MTKATYSETIFNEKWVILAFLLGHMLSFLITGMGASVSRIIFDAFFLWVLGVYLFHTVISRKYLRGRFQITSQCFVLVLLTATVIWRRYYQISVIRDFSILVFYLFICINGVKEQGKRLLDEIAFLLIIYSFIMSLISFVSIELNTPFIQIVSDNRVRGYYSNSNIAGMYCVISAVMVWYWQRRKILLERIPYFRAFAVLNCAVQMLMLWKTKSRTALIAAMILLISWILHSEKFQSMKQRAAQKYGKKYSIFAVLLVAGILYFLLLTPYGLPRNIYYYMHEAFTSTDPKYSTWTGKLNYITSNRMFLWEAAFQKIREFPIIGYGLNCIGKVFQLYESYDNTHNLLINTLLYSGVIGLGLLLYLLYLFFSGAKKSGNGMAYLFYYFLIAFFLAALLDKYILYTDEIINAVFWIVSGYLMSQETYDSKESREH